MTPSLPPSTRSPAAAGLSQAAQKQQFALQVCSECQTVQYPPRDVCAHCLGDALPWQPVSPYATLMASTTLHHSNEPYFQEKLPWRIGTVQLDCGPVAIAHLSASLQSGDRVCVSLELDPAGVGVLVAHPLSPTRHQETQP